MLRAVARVRDERGSWDGDAAEESVGARRRLEPIAGTGWGEHDATAQDSLQHGAALRHAAAQQPTPFVQAVLDDPFRQTWYWREAAEFGIDFPNPRSGPPRHDCALQVSGRRLYSREQPPPGTGRLLKTGWKNVRYSSPIVAVAVTLALVTLTEWAFGFPPLILLIAPIALTFIYAGRGPGFVALATAAVGGDYLFVEPARQFTFHSEGLVLTLFLSVGTLFMYFSVRRDGRQRSERWR